MSRAVVPELPQCKLELGAWNREPEIATSDSRIRETSTPIWRNTRAVLFTSSPLRMPRISLWPRASAASMSTRWEMLLSPGGRTTPLTRRALRVTRQPPPPLRRPREPRGERGSVANLQRALHGAERLLERAQRRKNLVAVHEEDFRPQRGLACREARRVRRALAER